MIINLPFGYAARHHIYYDTERKRGTIKLWSSYSGPITGAGANESQQGSPSIPGEALFRTDQHTEFAIADEQDILSMLASLADVTSGNDSSFASKEGRRIALSLKKGGKSKKDVITVKIQYGKEAKLTIGEAHKLHTIAMDILRDLGYSDQEISKRLESLTKVAPA